MSRTTLYLGYAPDPYPLEQFDIKQQTACSIDGTQVVATIIGSSHYIAAPEDGFYEVFSCAPVETPFVEQIPLVEDLKRRFRYETDTTAVETTVDCRPLESFPGPETIPITYRFGPDAYTTIDYTIEDGWYETYHTYPEYDIAVYTETETSSIDAATADPLITTPTNDTPTQ